MRFPTRSDVTDAAPRVVRAVATVVRQAPSLASYAVQLSAEAAGGLRERARQRFGGERPKPQAPSAAAFEAGAPGAARPFADRVAERAAKQAETEGAVAEGAAAQGAEAVAASGEKPPGQLEPDQLPISDWDHASMPSLRARVARLSLDELLRLRAYETEHAGRLAVLTMLDNRIAKVAPTRGGD